MLDQDADEPLVRAEDRAVEHHRAMLLPVLADVACVEPFRQHPVGLQGADLPGAPDRVLQVPFELGRIESAFARQLLPAELLRRHARSDDRLAKLVLGLVPILVAAEAVVGPQCELDRVIVETEIPVDAVGKLAERTRLVDDLVLAAEDVSIVLRELAHAHQPVKRAVRLVAVAAAVLVEADRQFAVAGDALLEDQDVPRAVHRLQRHQVGLARQDRRVVVGARDLVRARRTCSRDTCPSGRSSPTAWRPSAAAS